MRPASTILTKFDAEMNGDLHPLFIPFGISYVTELSCNAVRVEVQWEQYFNKKSEGSQMIQETSIPQLDSKILNGTKIHIGRDKALCRVGDQIQFFTAEGPARRLLKIVTCTAVVPAEFAGGEEWKINGNWLPYPQIELLAKNSGFDDYDAMLKWTLERKGTHWQGWLIAWGPAPYLPGWKS